MNCNDFTKCIDDYMDETCAESVHVVCHEHVADCSDCSAEVERNRQLRRLLATLPVPEPSPGFFGRALEQSMNTAVQAGIDRAGIVRLVQPGFGSWRAAVGGALAAGLVMLALLGIFLAPDRGSPVPDIPELTLSLNVPDTVRLSFNSDVTLTNARFILTIPQGMDVIGADGRRRIAWNTDILRGANILELPVIVHDTNGGILTATVVHESRKRTFSIRIFVI